MAEFLGFACTSQTPASAGGSRARLTVLFVGLSLLLAVSAAWAQQITDDRGRVVTLTAVPQRIVSLLPSLTETVCALGQCQRLVGVDRHSDYPPQVRALPQLGAGLDPNIEAVLALKPDLVLISVASRASDRLEALGLKVVALSTGSHADVKRVVLQLGALLAAKQAGAVWDSLDAAVQAAAQGLPGRVRGKTFFFEVSPGPYAAGSSSFIGETMRRLGVSNVVPAQLGDYPKLSPEFLAQADPDIVLVANRGSQAEPAYPGWQSLRAVRQHRVCLFTREQTDVLVRPGPRLAEAARLLAGCLQEKLP